MAPASRKAHWIKASIDLIKAGGPVCIALAVLTLCACVLWRFAGRELAGFTIDGLRLARDISMAQERAADATAKSIDMAGRIVERATKTLESSYRQAGG